jgi:hypothetical protein
MVIVISLGIIIVHGVLMSAPINARLRVYQDNVCLPL